MGPAHLQFWPAGVPRVIEPISHTLDDHLRRAAARHPAKPATVFYGALKSYAELDAEVSLIAGWLQAVGLVQPGDRVGLFMQNSPQFVAAFHGIVRAGGVVVPMNAMYRTEELRHIVHDAGLRVVFTAQDLLEPLRPLLGEGGLLPHVVVATYADELPQPHPEGLPGWLTAAAAEAPAGTTPWSRMLAAGHAPRPVALSPSDLCALPYTSGSTGRGRGCRHTHATTLHALAAITEWFGMTADDVTLAAAPMFHVVGLQAGMNATIAVGGTLVILPRWDRDIAARLMRAHGVTLWPTVPTAVIDFLNRSDLRPDDLATLRAVFGGGSAMPEAVAGRLHGMTGLHFVECYGMTETMAPVTSNPPQRPKAHCAGVPVIGTELRILDVETRQPVADGAVGEIAVSGPQVMLGYWQSPEADDEAFVTIDGRRFLRTGDLGHIDDEGYVHIADRLKRMINVSGYKVWPAEVESRLFAHPAIAEVCVIAARDPYRGETVKAVAVLKPGHELTADALQQWAQQHMAAYKVPRLLQVVASLPKSGAGKVQWRELQDAQTAADHSA